MKELSEISKEAIEICQELGVPYSFGKGYATLDGVPINKLDKKDQILFEGNEKDES